MIDYCPTNMVSTTMSGTLEPLEPLERGTQLKVNAYGGTKRRATEAGRRIE